MPPRSLIFAAFLGLVVVQAHATTVSDWTKLKGGMNGDEATRQLGQPLIRTTGRGVEIWIYDGCGEAVFDGGPLKSWRAATPSAESLARPVSSDISLPATARRKTRLAPVQALPARTYQEISTTRFRAG
jgi:hypothetical protein